MAPTGKHVSRLGLQLVELFGKDWRCGLFEGGVSLGAGFVVLELHASPSLTLSGCKLKISCELSAAAPVPWQPAVILSTMIIMG